MTNLSVEVSFEKDVLTQSRNAYAGGVVWVDEMLKKQKEKEPSVRDIFILDEANIKVDKNGKILSFKVFLTEWLETLTSFLNECEQKSVFDFQQQMLLSGVYFNAKSTAKSIFITIFTKDGENELELTKNDAEIFHKKLQSYLFQKIEALLGVEQKVLGKELFEIRKGSESV